MSFTTEQRFIVTGASSGIGACTALLLNELGATVIAVARRESALFENRNKASQLDNFIVEPYDLVGDLDALSGFVKGLCAKYGKLSGMAYCAGTMPAIPLRAVDAGKMKEVFNINFFAPVMMMRAVADKRNSIGSGTSCVFISSASSILSDKGHGVYGASKAALNAAMRSFAKELAPGGIRVNCILPTNIQTAQTTQEYIDSQIAQYPMGFGKPVDVAHLVAFLLSSESKWITAQNYVLDCASF